MSGQLSLNLKPEGTCPHCGAKVVEYKHNICVGLVRGLEALLIKGGTSKLADLHLTLSQSNNFQKLQYWQLIEKSKGGRWRITQRGFDFIEGRIAVPQSVWTYRGSVVRTDKVFIFARNVKGFYRQREDYSGDAIARG